MVAPNYIEDHVLVRSFVKVPGSGSDASAKPSICDLSRASSFAATVSVHHNLPPDTIAVCIPNAEVQKLKEENEKLRKKSETLQKQMTLCKLQLIENVQKLKERKEEIDKLRKESETLRRVITMFKLELIQNPKRSIICVSSKRKLKRLRNTI